MGLRKRLLGKRQKGLNTGIFHASGSGSSILSDGRLPLYRHRRAQSVPALCKFRACPLQGVQYGDVAVGVLLRLRGRDFGLRSL